MKKILTILFIGLLNFTNQASSDDKILNSLKEGKKLIFIRHAIAPGNGDPNNFDINDCSTQKEYDKYNWDKEKVIYICLEENSKKKFGFPCPGGYQRNFGIEVSTGKYIAFCDDDDVWLPKKLELQIQAMKKTGCKMSSTESFIGYGVYNSKHTYRRFNAEHAYNHIQNAYRGTNLVVNGLPKIWNLNFLKYNNCMICSSVIIDKEIIDKTGKFIIDKHSEDYEYWLRALQHTNSVYIQDVCVYYDMGHGGCKSW